MVSKPPRKRLPLFHTEHVEMTAFLYEIVAAADALRDARAFDGSPAAAARSRRIACCT